VPVTGLLLDALARLERGDLTVDLVLDGTPERAQRVHVLDLDLGAELVGADAAHRHVGVDAHRALFHLHVGDADGAQHAAQLRDVRARLLRRPDLGSAHDLHERHASAVVVDERVRGFVDATAATDVHGLAGVLFEVRALDPDRYAVD